MNPPNHELKVICPPEPPGKHPDKRPKAYKVQVKDKTASLRPPHEWEGYKGDGIDFVSPCLDEFWVLVRPVGHSAKLFSEDSFRVVPPVTKTIVADTTDPDGIEFELVVWVPEGDENDDNLADHGSPPRIIIKPGG